LPLMQAVSLDWSCPSSPGSCRCSWTRWVPAQWAVLRAGGLGSRRAPRRPFAPQPVHHPGRACAAPWRTSARAGAAPGAPVGAWPARWSSPARCLDAAVGGQLIALPV